MTDLRLDHVLIAVRDLDTATDRYALDLGFNLTPVGIHPGRGTHNRIIPFGSEYLELIAIRDADEPITRLSLPGLLERREGLYMFALGTDDIEASAANLRKRGVSVQSPYNGKREGNAESPGYSWKSADIGLSATPGSETFLIQHNSPIEKRYPEPSNIAEHPNGVIGIDSLGILVIDAETSAFVWQEAFGFDASPVEDLPQRGLRRVRFELRNCFLDIISPMRTGAMTRFLERMGEAPYLLSLGVRDLSETISVLSQRGIPTRNEVYDEYGHSILVYPADANGVLIQFIETED